MATAKTAPITPNVLAWAINEDGRSVPTIAVAAKVTSAAVRAWVAGQERPTAGQLSEVAKVLGRPRALFFLPEPPVTATLSADYRRAVDSSEEVSSIARRRIRQARRVQGAVSWARTQAAAERVGFPRWNGRSGAGAGAAALRRWVGVTTDAIASCSEDIDALRIWRAALDARGVLVFELGIGSGEVRGFSSWDEGAPLVAYNLSGVSPAARSFTIAHECAHLYRRQDSACADLPDDAQSTGGAGVERWCEEFAAAFLMPADDVRALAGTLSNPVTIADVRVISRAFHVSARAAALRLHDLELADDTLYPQVLAVFRARQRGGTPMSPPRPVARIRQYGPHTLESVLNALPPRDALSVLRITVEDARAIASEIGSDIRVS